MNSGYFGAERDFKRDLTCYFAVQKEVWIRSHALLVLIYEGIVTGVLDYDYSSQAIVVGKQRPHRCA